MPTLLLSSREDHVVDPVSGDVLEQKAGGPVERVFLENSYHVATLDWDAPLIESSGRRVRRDRHGWCGLVTRLMARPLR